MYKKYFIVLEKTIIFLFIFLVFTGNIFCESSSESIEDEENIVYLYNEINNINDPDLLWELLNAVRDSEKKAEIIIALSKYGKGKKRTIENLNKYLMEMNKSFREGGIVDYIVVSACISAILELADGSSYPVLLNTICSGYPEVIAFEAQGAFELIPGNLQRFLLDVIEKNPDDEKFTAFRIVLNSDILNERLSILERGLLAEIALEYSLRADRNNADLLEMRYDAVLMLTRLQWKRANTLAISHYHYILIDFQKGIVTKERFIDSILCLGAVGNSDAALVLGLQLGLRNIRTERTGEFDPEIIQAIVEALGLIGDKAAYEHLLNVTILPYPDYIIAEAREAISRLKW
ncbi:MAG: hypothetical protein FWB86_00330 [Treponema sp.]|nr:hypothetical protein [Treponema sp.]MCL2251333.1 hypothetical protein [Treponema sp.]